MARIRIQKSICLWILLAGLIFGACQRADFPSTNPVEAPVIADDFNHESITLPIIWSQVKDDFPKSPNGKNFIFERITTEHGLSQNVVRVIMQDSFGYIWIGTNYGLDRYDGDEFVAYRHNPENLQSISDNHVWAIHEDSRNNLWVGTENGLNLFDRRRNLFIRFMHDEKNTKTISNNRIRTVIEDSNGNIWVGTWGGGLDRYDQQSGEFIHYRNNNSMNEIISDNFVKTIYEDSRGLLWVGTSNGLNRLDPRSGKNIIFQRDQPFPPEIFEYEIEMMYGGDFEYFWSRRPIPLDTALPEEEPQFLVNNQIQALIEDDVERKIWIGTSGGLDCFNLNTGSFDHFRFNSEDSHSISSNLVLSLMIDQNGTLWVGTNNGLNEFNEENKNFIRYLYNSQDPDSPKHMSNPIVNTIFQDRSGAIWAGTSGGGINRFDHSTDFFVHNFHDPNNNATVSGNMIWSFEEDSDLGYFVGSEAGIDRYNILSGQFDHYDFEDVGGIKQAFIQVYAVYKDFNANVWAGTSNGLYQYEPENHLFRKFVIDFDRNPAQADVFSEAIILDIIETNPGTLWAGTYGSGLIQFNLNSNLVRSFNFQQDDISSISSNIISALLVDRSGSLYVGTRGGGLNRYQPESDAFIRYTSDPADANSISDNNINELFKAGDGDIWIATMGGLNKFNPDTATFRIYTEENGLPSNVIYGIVEDDKGNIWVSTSNGVSRFSMENEIFTNYQFSHGLQANEFNPGASFISADGMVFFGGINGFTVFRPQLLAANPIIPNTLLSSLSQNREEIVLPISLEYSKNIELEWPRNYFEFKASNLNFIQRDKNLIAYKLSPLDSDWNYASSAMHHAYENLDGGNYTLFLKGSNNDGQWGNDLAAITINVTPPFWENRSFRFGSVVLLIIALAALVQFRVRNVQRYSRSLEKEVKDRTEDIEKRRKVAEGLREILVRINSDQSISESLDFVVCQTTRLLDTPVAIIFSSENDRKVKIIAYSELEENPLKASISDGLLETNLKEWAARISKSRRIFKAGSGSRLEQYLAKEQIYFRIVPINSMKTVLGGLAVLETQDCQINEEDLDLLKSLADQAALAMENARLRETTEELAVISERNRIARDLHDAITQTLFSANLIAESLPQTLEKDQKKGKESLKDLQDLNKSALAEMRALLLELRPDVIKDISISELLEQMAATLRGRAGVEVSLDLVEKYQVPEQIHLQIYRITQEAITNIIKHSKAGNVSIVLRTHGYKRNSQQYGSVRMNITDDGIGFDPNSVKGAHFGIKDMTERAEAIGAVIRINSAIGNGTSIKISWKGKDRQDGGCE